MAVPVHERSFGVEEATVSRFVAMLVALELLLIPSVAQAQTAPACQYILGFKTLHDSIPAIVGDCLDNEAHNPTNGDGLQHTTNGLLVWRKADNNMAFTNGSVSWIEGEGGIVSRPNTVRFVWESNPDKLPVTDGTITQEPGTCPVPASDPNGPVTVASTVFPDPKAFPPKNQCLTALMDTTTDRLYAYLSSHPGTSLCRCQNIPQSQSIYGHPSDTGWVAVVSQYWPIPGAAETDVFDVSVVQSSRGWLIDDIRCAGDNADSSVYAGSNSRCKQ